MTPSYLNLSSSPTTSDHDDHHHHPSILSSDTCQAASSSTYIITTRNFFDSPSCQDQSEIYQQDDQQPQFQQDLADNFASHGAISYHVENECSENGLKFSIWKNEEIYENLDTSTCQIKWMSTKMRLKHKIKKDAETPTSNTINYTPIEDDQKQQKPPAHMETDESSNNNSSNSSMISNSALIRTCSDCNTTKTPLWRSGPQGPKSLCNACGIRQRKARRAMAAAAAANDTAAAFEKETTPPVLVIKNKKINNSKTKTKQQKDKTSNPCTVLNVAKFKKQSCSLMTPGPHHQVQKKVCMEEFLLTLSNNLACDYKVLPQDEKDAAILLMALSFDHVRRI